MTEQFDPYHVWLGIAPKDQPPNHYRLLSVDLFETDPDVIENDSALAAAQPPAQKNESSKPPAGESPIQPSPSSPHWSAPEHWRTLARAIRYRSARNFASRLLVFRGVAVEPDVGTVTTLAA